MADEQFAGLRGLLLDLNGVFYDDDGPIEAGREALDALRSAGLPLRFLTNTTTRPRAGIAERLDEMGYAIRAEEIMTPMVAARLLIEREGYRRINLAAAPALAEDLPAGVEPVDDEADAVVLGDLYKEFTWDRLNEIFRMLRNGARLIALHKNRISRRDEGIALDLGPFVAALEYAADIEAAVLGKPSRQFFDLALASLDVAAEEALMVGDDVEADVGGAQAAGLRAVLVRTGKFSEADERREDIGPDAIIDDIGALPGLLGLS